jgi:hypothetical protein
MQRRARVTLSRRPTFSAAIRVLIQSRYLSNLQRPARARPPPQSSALGCRCELRIEGRFVLAPVKRPEEARLNVGYSTGQRGARVAPAFMCTA